jgi:Asp-tRNA(Asn)/Glu-tRNA(Gln) amidotransferase A subunit family amidase
VFSSLEVVRAFLQRIEAVNSRINSVVVLARERALAEARRADASLARGDALGRLHGVPFTAKDVFDSAGVETSAGMPDRVGVVPSEDAVAVARMRRAGAILWARRTCLPAVPAA